MAASDSSVGQLPHGPRSGGRPPLKQSSVEQLTVTVSSAPVRSAGVVCALQIPHKLLLSWHSLVLSAKGRYLECLNKSIAGGVIAVDQDCKRLDGRLASVAAYVRAKERALTGRARVKVRSSSIRV